MNQRLSVVVPCYNEEAVINETYKQLSSELEKICEKYALKFELIFVNDGSTDATLPMLHAIRETHKASKQNTLGEVFIVALARNFGHQIALTAGLTHSTGDAIIAIDADLQDPPRVMEEMVLRYKDGVDVAYGVRTEREGETFFKLFTAKLFYIIVRKLTGINIPLDTGDFRLMSRRALDVFISMKEKQRFIRGMIPWIGYRQEAVYYKRAARFAGITKYPFSKMIKLAFDGITSFSDAPLKIAYVIGIVSGAISLIYALFLICASVTNKGPSIQGWHFVMVGLFFLGAVQLVTIGILGEYIGRIYDEVKGRPLFTLDDKMSTLKRNQ